MWIVFIKAFDYMKFDLLILTWTLALKHCRSKSCYFSIKEKYYLILSVVWLLNLSNNNIIILGTK